MEMEKEVWKDISEETYREYVYPDGSKLGINAPAELHISPSTLGGHAHRIKTKEGFAYYVRSGWNAIRWQVKEGNDLFKF